MFILHAGERIESCGICACAYSRKSREHVADCAYRNLLELPQSLPTDLHRLRFSGNHLSHLGPPQSHLVVVYLQHVTFLDLSSSRVESISPEFLSIFLDKTSNLKFLDLSDNNLKTLPQEGLQSLTEKLTSLNILGNAFECTCSNLWMKDWLREDNTTVQVWSTI